MLTKPPNRTRHQKHERHKAEFVRIASHQLRTPLTTINWYVEMLRAGDAGKLNPAQKAYLREVSASAQYMIELINKILDATKADQGCIIMHGPDAKPASRTRVCVKRKTH